MFWRASTIIIKPPTIFAVLDVTLCQQFVESLIGKGQCTCAAMSRYFGEMMSVRDETKILTTNLRA
ncbi:uncharacterized protein Bfra_010721 [Botrytis fragariae]|uniref:Uncharacterized protein n=1 Tax=Botrytis fragariae TaxID=1964551 RepID=A0A8H6ECZ1_9HELO|nr:uncharacterized protein Bfra_010721 [Botrytis fragariae]KAF5867751.1 hypothetical protein Bfra_010721 [Botrytis fragariae]